MTPLALRTAGFALLALTPACDGPGGYDRLVFVDGRGVDAVSDTLLAFTVEGVPAVLVLDVVARRMDTVAAGSLSSPVHVQRVGDRWFVSDAESGAFSIVVLAADGRVERRIPLAGISATPHQFVALEDGSIVVVGLDDRLVRLIGDSVATFALARAGSRPPLLLGAAGGVLHAVPDDHIALYNAFGNIRWRVEWPWTEDIFITDLAVDARGRIHTLAGVPNEGNGVFVVYSVVATTGEIDRWSAPGSTATFAVSRLGEVSQDSLSGWVGAPGEP